MNEARFFDFLFRWGLQWNIGISIASAELSERGT